MYSEQEIIKRNKLEEIKNHVNAYPERYEVTHELEDAQSLNDGESNISIAGRIVFMRKMGKLTFAMIKDIKGKLQVAFKKDVLGDEKYEFFMNYVDIGDFVGVKGEMFTTQTGEKTVRVSEFTFLGKSLKTLPEKWHGLSDKELCYRNRYLDLIMNDESKNRFIFKSKFISKIRNYLEENRYLEIETPTLINKPAGALAKPFISHHNALDIDVYLRIAPETYLKRAIVGGFTRVFEFARCFRNEGISPVHLQDFTMLECYCAYYNYKDNMILIKDMMKKVIYDLFGKYEITIDDKIINFDKEWEIVTFREIILKDCGIDINECKTADELRKKIADKKIELDSETSINVLGFGNLIDVLYKKVSRPKIINPTFLTEHPIDLSPLARANDENPNITDRFQLIINGAEVVNAYSELVEPIEQEKRLEEQSKLNANGDEDAMVMDKEYIEAMEYGMPPISGWGMGIDRIVQILTNADNIRDCVLFPVMRPINDDDEQK
ncbi:MAG TPA: lysine--tRNA ligase [Clostridiales bacterium]|nr:MAG: lysine--tRNA ligase [Clostridiales bacterium GWD2_32_59]HAN10029.1 lysine--tRNA ligase [Clostridiales bacterium]